MPRELTRKLSDGRIKAKCYVLDGILVSVCFFFSSSITPVPEGTWHSRSKLLPNYDDYATEGYDATTGHSIEVIDSGEAFYHMNSYGARFIQGGKGAWRSFEHSGPS